MDVILLKDVEKLGTEGAIVKVRPGYARNFLVPSGFAVPVTTARLKVVEEVKRQRRRQTARARTAADALKQQIEACSLTVTLTVGEGDKPFGSVTAHDLVEALAGHGVRVEKHLVHLEEPIKALGVHRVPVKVHANLTAIVTVSVIKA